MKRGELMARKMSGDARRAAYYVWRAGEEDSLQIAVFERKKGTVIFVGNELISLPHYRKVDPTPNEVVGLARMAIKDFEKEEG